MPYISPSGHDLLTKFQKITKKNLRCTKRRQRAFFCAGKPPLHIHPGKEHFEKIEYPIKRWRSTALRHVAPYDTCPQQQDGNMTDQSVWSIKWEILVKLRFNCFVFSPSTPLFSNHMLFIPFACAPALFCGCYRRS